MEREPRCSVYKNGITFTAKDIKGLLTFLYDGASMKTLFAGSRCNKEREYSDRYGRYNDPACRDLSPDVFHLMLTNVIGIQQRSFSESYFIVIFTLILQSLIPTHLLRSGTSLCEDTQSWNNFDTRLITQVNISTANIAGRSIHSL